MSKTLGLINTQLIAMLIAYPVWVGRSYKVSWWKWFLMALVVSVTSFVLLTIACYAGICL